MLYYSTNGKADKTDFKQAIISGLAPDRGLYMPEEIRPVRQDTYTQECFSRMAYEIAKILIDREIPDRELLQITNQAFNFDVPLRKIHDSIYSLELYHGPTAAFKDFGARFMSRVMSYFLKQSNKKITILVATSGDTGSAVARGFYQVPNIDVVILYPSQKVSYLQEKQLTTLGRNITALEVEGTFDDCQKMVKDAFMDEDLKQKMNLSSANSINIGRLLPQSFYYFWAYQQLKQEKEIIFCTPSGNFGNLTAGILAKRMGLPVKNFIAATNVNDVVPEYLSSGSYNPRPSIPTFSNAMDVGDPSNFSRLLDLYQTYENMKSDILGFKVTDEETLKTIRQVYHDHQYILDPHGAVGYQAIRWYLDQNPGCNQAFILLETAHPAKFGDTIHKAIDIDVEIPHVLQESLQKEKQSIVISAQKDALKEFLCGKRQTV